MGHHIGSRQFWQYASFALALGATVGSLFFSAVMALPPCDLCWYQRIAMFPLVAVLAVGIVRRDRSAALYALPLAAAGLAVAGYHNLLYYGVIPESLAPCGAGASCTTRQIAWAGFVSIPLLSLLSFAAVTTCLVLSWRRAREERS